MGFLRSAAIAASMSTGLVTFMPEPAAAAAQAAERHSYHLPPQPLADSLRAVGIASGRSIGASADLLSGRHAPALKGDFTAEEAVTALLAGSGLRYRAVGAGHRHRRGRLQRAPPLPHLNVPEIVVTGTRIRQAPIASPVIQLDQNAMRDAGQTSLGDVVRTIPQNFGGGQNPGVGANVPSASGINVGSASTINLRGLGSDATLTLLNGHRLAYNGSRQGIDISAIPLAIVDRIEIVADGASALYGSDAVAGVANIILKRDYDGVEARANIGASTDGGNFQQQYGALAGARWSSGGVIAAYEFARNTDIRSDDRSYATSRPGVTLYPALRRHAMAVAGHQALSDTLDFQLDALFNKRWSEVGFPLNAAGDREISRIEQRSTSRSFALGAFPHPRCVSMTGNCRYPAFTARNGSFCAAIAFADGVQTSANSVCYCNNGSSVELAANGGLFRLPGGPLKLAVGTGYRNNTLDAFRSEGDANNVKRSQDSHYIYGELSVPLIDGEQKSPASTIKPERCPALRALSRHRRRYDAEVRRHLCANHRRHSKGKLGPVVSCADALSAVSGADRASLSGSKSGWHGRCGGHRPATTGRQRRTLRLNALERGRRRSKYGHSFFNG